jgi:hypothetical protein
MTPKQQLDAFLRKYSPEIAAEARAAHAKMRRLVPGAIEMVYDNYMALVIGFGPTERPSDAIFSLAVLPRWVTLCFLQGASLPRAADPKRPLKGGGNVVRNVRLGDAGDLDEPAVRALLDAALAHAKVPMNPKQRRRRPPTGGK